MNIKAVFDLAPPTPACFASRTAWSEYLNSAQRDSGARLYAKPFLDGVYRPTFNFCIGCLPEFKAGMREAGKCQPNKFRALVLVKEAA